MEWKFKEDTPIYLQIAERIRYAIASGEFSAGERIPGVRDIAAESKVNPNTVQRGLAMLEEEGLVSTAGTSGRFVTSAPDIIAAARAKLLSGRVSAFLNEMRGLGAAEAEILKYIKE